MTKIPKKIKKINPIKPLTAKQKHKQLITNLKNQKKELATLNIHLKEANKVLEKINKYADKTEKTVIKIENILDNEQKKFDNERK